MKKEIRLRLQKAQNWCNENDKDTPFMLKYMQDVAGVDLDCVLSFLKNGGMNLYEWFSELEKIAEEMDYRWLIGEVSDCEIYFDVELTPEDALIQIVGQSFKK